MHRATQLAQTAAQACTVAGSVCLTLVATVAPLTFMSRTERRLRGDFLAHLRSKAASGSLIATGKATGDEPERAAASASIVFNDGLPPPP